MDGAAACVVVLAAVVTAGRVEVFAMAFVDAADVSADAEDDVEVDAEDDVADAVDPAADAAEAGSVRSGTVTWAKVGSTVVAAVAAARAAVDDVVLADWPTEQAPVRSTLTANTAVTRAVRNRCVVIGPRACGWSRALGVPVRA